jgi:hemolysin activation/secretion protein
VRGYTEAQALGDDGLRASLELGSPNFGRQLARAIEESRLYLFYDWGKLRIQQPLPGQLSDFRLSGTGVGFRMSAFKHLKLVADAAWALRDLGDVQSGDVRGDFSIEYRF